MAKDKAASEARTALYYKYGTVEPKNREQKRYFEQQYRYYQHRNLVEPVVMTKE